MTKKNKVNEYQILRVKIIEIIIQTINNWNDLKNYYQLVHNQNIINIDFNKKIFSTLKSIKNKIFKVEIKEDEIFIPCLKIKWLKDKYFSKCVF